jgi:hypothetical protein
VARIKKLESLDSEMVTENAVAIGMEFATDPQYDEAYEQLHEIQEFYGVAIRAGVALEKFAMDEGIFWDENADWILTVETYSANIMAMLVVGRIPSDRELEKLVSVSIKK